MCGVYGAYGVCGVYGAYGVCGVYGAYICTSCESTDHLLWSMPFITLFFALCKTKISVTHEHQ